MEALIMAAVFLSLYVVVNVLDPKPKKGSVK